MSKKDIDLNNKQVIGDIRGRMSWGQNHRYSATNLQKPEQNMNSHDLRLHQNHCGWASEIRLSPVENGGLNPGNLRYRKLYTLYTFVHGKTYYK